MAGYNKGIVATRNLNASLGRGGDTKIRGVGGKDSHVNAFEAYLIDVNGRAGEVYAERFGAGTINPITGMREYHGNHYTDNKDHVHSSTNDVEYFYTTTDSEGNTIRDNSMTPGNVAHDINKLEGEQDYSVLSGLTDAQMGAYVSEEFGIDYTPTLVEDLQDFTSSFKDEPFDFIKQQKDLATTKAGDIKEFTELGLTEASRFGAEERRNLYGDIGVSLGKNLQGGYKGALQGSDIASQKTGMGYSGTATQAFEAQKGELFKDYSTGMNIATRDLVQGRKKAGSDLFMGQKGADITYEGSIAAADLAFDIDTYTEKTRQTDKFYGELGSYIQNL